MKYIIKVSYYDGVGGNGRKESAVFSGKLVFFCRSHLNHHKLCIPGIVKYIFILDGSARQATR